MTATLPAGRGRRCRGTRQVLAFNWPKYLAGVATGAAGLALAAAPALPAPARAAGAAAGLAAAWLLGASLAATWWAYDHSGLGDWDWLVGALPGRPRRWAALHCGFDEASPALARRLGTAPVAVLDLGPSLPGQTASLRRARARAHAALRPARAGALPLADAQLDAAFLVFAAHELRRAADRASLFAELARVLTPGGVVAVVEHPRDLANLLAYGPGAGHFYPRGEWRRRARAAGFTVRAELPQTPFVRGFLLCRD